MLFEKIIIYTKNLEDLKLNEKRQPIGADAETTGPSERVSGSHQEEVVGPTLPDGHTVLGGTHKRSTQSRQSPGTGRPTRARLGAV